MSTEVKTEIGLDVRSLTDLEVSAICAKLHELGLSLDYCTYGSVCHVKCIVAIPEPYSYDLYCQLEPDELDVKIFCGTDVELFLEEIKNVLQ